ncbi:C-Jun-amino-terminal kinase-interacting protein 4-like isoform X2 [Centruroides vittatus]|uniref:C-Jun-amino-terminal kinase-interacting protein 4-like isoform X2 n=1 Tax=Centruroides vittatus TaxID=120091 RepID=UPI00350FC92C
MDMDTDVMQETVYGTNSDDNSVVMSEKVQTLAGNIYQEFEKMIGKYDEDVVKELMPLVVNVLENLDLAVMENQEHEVELELLREDNEQLVTQYEREKQLRKATEQRLLEMEYSVEDDKRDLQGKVESLESIVRMLELKAKNSNDHASRLEEKETEMRKEYTKLHERYTELFKTHMDYMERTKILFGTERLEAITNKSRQGLNFSGLRTESSLYSNSLNTPTKSIVSLVDFPSIVSPNASSSSNTSLKSELQDLQSSSAVTSPTSTNAESRDSLQKYSRNRNKETSEKGQLTDIILQSDRSTATKGGWIDGFDSDISDIAQPGFSTSPELEDIEDISQDLSFGPETTLKREHRRPNTLYQELSFHDNDALGENDEGADITGGYVHPGDYASSVTDNFFGMGKEVENLIIENNELLATKNALNIVKDDLIAKVDELTSEQEILREEIKSLQTMKDRFKQKITELEEELRRVKEDNEKSKSNKSDDEEDVPMAQRKRFTRVEMARVLMERNQYKERLMELQEAVRWTEMIRASRNDPTLETKRNRSSIWKFFGNLFNPNEKPPRKQMPYVNVRYNAPTHSSPALDMMRKKRLGDRHRGLDFLDSDLSSERLQQQRAKERREQYKQVRAHVRKEDGRMQAYGWSLPYRKSTSSKPSNFETENKSKLSNHVPVPVPVYCRPLIEKEQGMKIWCAAGVDLSGGRSGDDKTSTESNTKIESQELHEQIELTQIEESKKKENPELLRSLVWICTSTHSNSKVTIIDANNPAEILSSFHVCSSYLLCIASVSGTKEDDYPVDEKFSKLGKEMENHDSNEIISEDSKQKNLSLTNNIGRIQFVQASVKVSGKSLNSEYGSIEDSTSHQNIENDKNMRDGRTLYETEKSNREDQIEKMSTVLPTMWLGSQDGNIYIHSAAAQWDTCIYLVKLKDSVLSIVHFKGRVFAALANGTAAIFHRDIDGQWDLINYHLLDLGQPHHSIRCMSIVYDKIWCGYRNQIHVINPRYLSLEKSFDAHPRKESQVRQMAWIGDGVWITIRLDSTLRLYHAHTHQHLQDVDVEPYVSKMLGTGKLGFSFVRITALLISCNRLWMGTGNGVVISVPLAERNKPTLTPNKSKTPGGVVRVYSDKKEDVTTNSYIPYCSMAQAQLSFHGHRDSVKFFVSVPGNNSDSIKQNNDYEEEIRKVAHTLVISGGEGYIDFRIGDGNNDEDIEGMISNDLETEKNIHNKLSKGERSHLIVWQVEKTD